MQRSLTLNIALMLLLAIGASSARDATAAEQTPATDKQFLLTYPNLDNPGGEVLLENEHVVVQRFVVGAGEWEGLHAHPGNQVYVHVVGGEWSGRAGGEPTYTGEFSEDGSVGWMEPIPLSEGHESGNTGDAPIDLIWVTLKDDAPIAPNAEHVPQVYPNIPLELLLEIYIHIKGGTWSGRSGGVQSPPFPFSETGSVGWMEAVPLSEGHESGNTGDTTIDLIWVTLK